MFIPPNTPFNIEKVWFDNANIVETWKYGILNMELFTNSDEDAGHYGESLIKRGLYPFKNKYFVNHLLNRKDLLSDFQSFLKKVKNLIVHTSVVKLGLEFVLYYV